MSTTSRSEALAEVKENLQYIASRGWFLPTPVGDHYATAFPRSKKGGALGYRKAAVLGIISYHNNKVQILMTKRSDNISFKGHPCLPGGSEDSEDSSLVETALREAEEEINLDRSKVEVVCTLPPHFTTLSGLTAVSTVIAILKCPPDELDLSPNPFEVDCYYWVPLELFLHHDKGLDFDQPSSWHVFSFNHVDPETKKEHRIWGLTSALCAFIAAIALNRAHNYDMAPLLISSLERQGEIVSVTFASIALTRTQAAMIPISKL